MKEYCSAAQPKVRLGHPLVLIVICKCNFVALLVAATCYNIKISAPYSSSRFNQSSTVSQCRSQWHVREIYGKSGHQTSLSHSCFFVDPCLWGYDERGMDVGSGLQRGGDFRQLTLSPRPTPVVLAAAGRARGRAPILPSLRSLRARGRSAIEHDLCTPHRRRSDRPADDEHGYRADLHRCAELPRHESEFELDFGAVGLDSIS